MRAMRDASLAQRGAKHKIRKAAQVRIRCYAARRPAAGARRVRMRFFRRRV